MITKEEWAEWKTHPVTHAFFEACGVRSDDAKELLAGQAGIDDKEDNFLRGFITAYREIPEFTIEGLNDD